MLLGQNCFGGIELRLLYIYNILVGVFQSEFSTILEVILRETSDSKVLYCYVCKINFKLPISQE